MNEAGLQLQGAALGIAPFPFVRSQTDSMRAATTLPALLLLAWLIRRPRPAVVAFLDRLLHALALLGLRVSTALGLLAHRVLHACHVFWKQRRARTGDLSDAGGSEACKAPALIPRNTSIHIVRSSSQRAAPPRAVGQGTPVPPRPTATAALPMAVPPPAPGLPVEVVALGPVPDGCIVDRVPFSGTPAAAAPGTEGSVVVVTDDGGVGSGGEVPPVLSFSFQGCAWMMHCTWALPQCLHDHVD